MWLLQTVFMEWTPKVWDRSDILRSCGFFVCFKNLMENSGLSPGKNVNVWTCTHIYLDIHLCIQLTVVALPSAPRTSSCDSSLDMNRCLISYCSALLVRLQGWENPHPWIAGVLFFGSSVIAILSRCSIWSWLIIVAGLSFLLVIEPEVRYCVFVVNCFCKEYFGFQ